TNLGTESRAVLTEVLDVPLIENEPGAIGDLRARPHSEFSTQRRKRVGGHATPQAVGHLPPDVGVLAFCDRFGWQQLNAYIRVAGRASRFGVKSRNLCVDRCAESGTPD